MNTLRSITGLFAMTSLFAFAAGCSVSEKQEQVGQDGQELIAPCECPTVAASSSNLIPPCDCPPEEEPPVDEPPVEEPPSDEPCPPGEHEECSVKAPGGVQSLIAPPECVCVPDEAPCPPHAVPVTTCGGIIAPAGAASIWGGTSCSTQCVSAY